VHFNVAGLKYQITDNEIPGIRFPAIDLPPKTKKTTPPMKYGYARYLLKTAMRPARAA
jgi:hypothetical protein